MSVQLIVYPQNFNGQYNAFSNTTSEAVVNGINFLNLDSASSYDSSVVLITNILPNAPATIPNTWYRFRTTGSGTPSLPTVTSGNLVLNSTTTATISGIYQRLTNLTIGQQYTFTINISTPAANGNMIVSAFDGTTVLTNQLFAASLSQITHTFTASSTDNTVMISYLNTVANNVTISDISLQPSGTSPNLTDFQLEDGQVICDLYENEDIPLSLSVDNFKNVAEKIQSYSKAFNLPATKRNNLIFDNMFEVTRSDDGIIFNPYVKTQCILKQDSFILFQGYLRMLDITDKDGEISYNVNLYSEAVALADFLKDKTFSELDFTELEHLYNYDNIKNSWNGTGTGITYTNASTSGFRDANLTVKYPFCDWNHQYTYNSTSNPALPSLESSFRPFINVKYLIDRIFNQTAFPFTYESTLFDSLEFKNLYMDFNWSGDENPNDSSSSNSAVYATTDTISYAPTTYTAMAFPSESFTNNSDWGYNSGTGVFTCPAGNQNSTYKLNSFFRFQAIENDTLSVRWVKNAGTATETILNAQSFTMGGTAYLTVDRTLGTGSLNTPVIQNADHVYSSTPSVTFESSSGSGAVGVVTIDGSGNIDSFTLTSAGSGYANDVRVRLNNVVNEESYYNSYLTVTMNPGDTLQPQWKAASSATSIIKKKFMYFSSNNNSVLSGVLSLQGITTNTLLQTLRGEIGQWEFLKGIMTMFNIITLPDEDNPNNVTFESYADVFIQNTNSGSMSDLTLASRSIQHDWTDKIDISQMKLTTLTDLNKETIFKFVEDDDDYAFGVYKKSTRHLYGSKKFDASGFTILEGTDEVVAEPFASTVVKPLMEQFPQFITPAIYSLNDDGDSSSFENAPRILFNNGIENLVGCTFDVPAQNNVAAATGETKFLQFSHLTDVPSGNTTNDFNFASHQLIGGVGTPPINNLFNSYWLPYYSELYNPDTRIMSIKVNLSPADINRFKFSDTVMIKNREFRVNKIDYKPGDLATVEFILIP